MGIAGINSTLIVLEMENFTQLCLMKFFLFPIQYPWYLSYISLLPLLLHIQIIIMHVQLISYNCIMEKLLNVLHAMLHYLFYIIRMQIC